MKSVCPPKNSPGVCHIFNGIRKPRIFIIKHYNVQSFSERFREYGILSSRLSRFVIVTPFVRKYKEPTNHYGVNNMSSNIKATSYNCTVETYTP